MNLVIDNVESHERWVPQVRRVFVFAPNLGWHEPQPKQNHPVNGLVWMIDPAH
jgi:hypothetical protein